VALDNQPAMFLAQSVVRDDKVALVVALRLSLNQINRIMQQGKGTGEHSETYLVGPDNLMRSDSLLDPNNRSVRASFANPAKGSVDTSTSRAALAGRQGQEIIENYREDKVLKSWRCRIFR